VPRWGCERASLTAVTTPVSYAAEAWNPVPDSENRIHSDEVAKAYGFRGGLVPGVTVSACLLHPAAVAWGRDWLARGCAHVTVHSPVYAGEAFHVDVVDATSRSYTATLVCAEGRRCATAEVSLPDAPPDPPVRRGDALLARDADRPPASREVMEALRSSGLGAMPARWDQASPMTRYLGDPAEMAPVFRDGGFANPSFVLGLTNWVLAANVRMSPHFRPVARETELVVEATIVDLFEKKGHCFVDVDVEAYDRADDAAVARMRLRAIYLMRGA